MNELFEYLNTSPEIEKIWINRKYKMLSINGNAMIGAPELWNLGYNGTGIKIAIVDSGIAWDHPNFILPNGSRKVIVNKCFMPDHSDVYDRGGHGTHVAGIAAGLGVPTLGIPPGVAPGAKLMNLNVFCGEGYTFSEVVMSALEFAVLGPDGTPNT